MQKLLLILICLFLSFQVKSDDEKNTTSKIQNKNFQVEIPAQKKVVRNDTTNEFDKYEKKISMIRIRCYSQRVSVPETFYSTDGKHLYEQLSGYAMYRVVINKNNEIERNLNTLGQTGRVGNHNRVLSIIKKGDENTFLIKGVDVFNDPSELYINFAERRVIDNGVELDCFRN